MDTSRAAKPGSQATQDVEVILLQRRDRLFEQLLETIREGKNASLKDLVESIRDYTEAFVVSDSVEKDGDGPAGKKDGNGGLQLVTATKEILKRVDRFQRVGGS